MTLDIASTHKRYDNLTIKKSLVLRTWKNTLKDEENLPDDFIKHAGVLVGIDPIE